MPKLKLTDKIRYERLTRKFIEVSGKPLTEATLLSLGIINKSLDGLAIKAMRLPGLPFGAKALWVDQSVKRHQVIALKQREWDEVPRCPRCQERFPGLRTEGRHICSNCGVPFIVHRVRSMVGRG